MCDTRYSDIEVGTIFKVLGGNGDDIIKMDDVFGRAYNIDRNIVMDTNDNWFVIPDPYTELRTVQKQSDETI